MLVDDGFVETLSSGHRAAHDILSNYDFYLRSDVRQRHQLFDIAEPVDFPDSHVLMEAGLCCEKVILLGKGRLRVYLTGESGRELTLYYVQPGESCPVNLGSAMTGAAAFASAAADRAVSAVAISSSEFRRACRSNAALADHVFAATIVRFGEIIGLVGEITTKRVDHRLAEYLLRKFDVSRDVPPMVETTHQSIALDIGSAREVVSRRLQELERSGAVKLRRGRIQLQDRCVLRRIIR